MWNIIKYIIIGIFGGVLGGMGMGGGTLLIPLLTLFGKVNQHTAQAINLTAFIPMAIVALIMHHKKKLIHYKGVLWIIIPAAALSVLGALTASSLRGELLGRLFGAFLALLGVWILFCEFKN